MAASTTTHPRVLQLGPLAPEAEALLGDAFPVTMVETGGLAGGRPDLAAIEGIATNGKTVIDAASMQLLPRLRVISCSGAGTDGIDAAEAARLGVKITTTSAVLAGDVADVTIGLLIATARDFRGANRHVLDGTWRRQRYPLGRSLGDASIGIVGLGNIGRAVATRAAAFGMKVAYTSRRRVDTAPWDHVTDITELARCSDILVLCCPGGEATRHLVSRDVLAALGAGGTLINVSRGTVVDEAALIDALDEGVIAAAGLDVCENEPDPNPSLARHPQVLLLPHIGSATKETRARMAEAMVTALRRELT